MKKKGFTLIELIVVIAIIAVLAAILIPAMLGFIKKSKITSANSSAKSIFTAAQSALTDMDTEDVFNTGKFTGTWAVTSNLENAFTKSAAVTSATNKNSTSEMLPVFYGKVYNYFTDIQKLSAVAFKIESGSCTAVAVANGNYPGATPKQFIVDNYVADTDYAASILTVLAAAE